MRNAFLSNLRREYGEYSLDEQMMPMLPMTQFHQWFDEASLKEQEDPSAMTLSTVDVLGRPDARVVLLKGIVDDRFVFYTNYQSIKAQEMAENAHVALTFYWSTLVRQVRIRGEVSRADAHLSDTYFASRPYESQIGAMISSQSRVILSRDVLEKKYERAKIENPASSLVKRPAFWGGYVVLPYEFEFWQGRNNRLHDRIQYVLDKDVWKRMRLAP